MLPFAVSLLLGLCLCACVCVGKNTFPVFSFSLLLSLLDGGSLQAPAGSVQVLMTRASAGTTARHRRLSATLMFSLTQCVCFPFVADSPGESAPPPYRRGNPVRTGR